MEIVEQIRAILKLKEEALVKRSSSVLAEILDPHFVYVNSHGDRFDKEEYVDLCCNSSEMRFKSQKTDDLQVQDFGSFAVATMDVHDRFEYSGKPFTATFRSLCVFKKSGAKWLWAAGQTMSLKDEE